MAGARTSDQAMLPHSSIASAKPSRLPGTAMLP